MKKAICMFISAVTAVVLVSCSDTEYSTQDITVFFKENRETFEEIKDEMFKYDDTDIYVQYKKKSQKIVINKEIGKKEEEITDNERLERLLKEYYSIDEPIDISESNYSNEILLKKDEDAKYRLLEFCLDDSSACQYIYYYEGDINDIIKGHKFSITRLDNNWYTWWFGKI